MLAFALAIALAATGAALHADGPGQAAVPNPEPYPPVGGTQPILDLAASALLPGYAFAQVPPPDSTPPTFVSSELDSATGVLTITFSEEIDVTPATDVVPTKIHIRESGSYTDGTTLAAGELGTTADGTTISFTLTAPHLTAVAGLATPELTIDPGAVRDTSGNPIVGTFDASTAVFVYAFSVLSQEINPHGMAFSNDGTKMFVIGHTGDDVNEYALSTAFDASTAEFVNATSVSSEETTPRGMAFSSDGAKMFVIGTGGNEVNEYALSAAFDASTAIHVDAFSVLSEETIPQGMAFSSDGAKMFVIGSGEGEVNEYALSAAFDASTAIHVDAFPVSSQDYIPADMAFSNDGAKMFVVGLDGKDINEYTLSAAFDASTATFVDAFSVSSQELAPQGMAFSSDGAKMFVIGSNDDEIDEYTLSSVYPITVTAFVTTWETTAADDSITIPGTGTYTVNWGDGTTDLDVTGLQTHAYASPGNHTVHISGGLEHINHSSYITNAAKLRSIDQWGDIRWTTMKYAFQGARNMVYNATDSPDLSGVASMLGMFYSNDRFNGSLSSWDVSGVTNMGNMFRAASSFNQPLGDWDVSNVTNMGDMFRAASSFNQPLGDWDVSNVTNMDSMFYGATTFNRPLDGWDVSQVADMSYMFQGASSFNQPLGDWDVSGVTGMRNMFNFATSFNRPLGDWNVSGVTNMNDMFSFASSFNGDISSWNVSGVTSMRNMFNFATSFNQPLGDWDVSGVTGMRNMFNFATSFNQNLGKWYIVPNSTEIERSAIPGVVGSISAQNSFLGEQGPIYSIASGPDSNHFEISGGNLLNMTSADSGQDEYTVRVAASGSALFGSNSRQAIAITVTGQADAIPPAFITTWETTAADDSITIPGTGTYTVNWGDGTAPEDVTGSVMHAYASPGNHTVHISGGLTAITLGDNATNAAKLRSIEQWGDIRWASMEDAFSGAANMRYNATDTPDLSGVSNMRYAFSNTDFGASLSDWDVSQVDSMSSMFAYSAFNGDISGWDVSGVTDMSSMFSTNSAFNGDLSSWNTSSVKLMNDMFYYSYFDGDISNWNVSGVMDMSYMFAESAFNGDLSSWNTSSVKLMNDMFYYSYFDGDISNWNVSGVMDMSYMFTGSAFSGNVSSWNVSSAEYMDSMFEGAASFNSDISGWDVSGVESMKDILFEAYSFDRNLGKWYIVPNATSIERSEIPGAVGSISAQSPLLDGHNPTYGIGGGSDGDHFEISDDNLLNMTSADSGQGSYAVNVTASGVGVFSGGNNWEVLSVTIAGEPVTETAPVVSRISLTSDPGEDGTYAIGEAVLATVTFSAEVAVGGMPTLELDFDGVPKTAAYNATASSGADVVFSYTVAEHDEAKGGIAIEADKIELNGGTIRSLGGADAALAHMAVGADPGHNVDSTRPELESALVDVLVDDMALVLTFYEPLDGDSTPPPAAFSVTVNGTANAVTSVAVNGTGVTLKLASAISPDDAVAVNYTAPDGDPIQNAAGNDAESFEKDVRVRGPLTAGFSLLPGNHDGENPFKVRIQFTEGIAGGTADFADAVETAGGAVEDQRRVGEDRAHWELDIRPDGRAAVTIALPATQTACEQAGAVCTGDGRPLSGSLEGTVFGPHGVTVSPTSVSATEGGAAGNYTVVLDAPPSGTATVTVTETGGDVTASPAILEFNATTWDAPQTVTVTAIDDSLPEDEELATLTHSVSGYNATAESVAVTVHDDDVDRSDQFVTSWRATPRDKMIIVPVGGETGNYTVNWGDGTVSDHQGDAIHRTTSRADTRSAYSATSPGSTLLARATPTRNSCTR